MQDLQTQIMRLEGIFDELHDFMCETEGEGTDIAIKALEGALFCRSLVCDLLSEQAIGED